METTNFRKYARLYNLFNQEKDYRGESSYISALIRQYGAGGTTLLELGCGAGGHAVEFKKEGFEVLGIERSAEMAALAVENGVECVVGDISEVGLNRQFDGVVSLFHVMSYLTEDEDLVRCFRLSNEHLVDGGVFIFDAWYSPAVSSQKPERREKVVYSEGLELKRLADPVMYADRNVVDVNYHFSISSPTGDVEESWLETHPMRHFSISDVETLANMTGFQLVKAEEFLTGAPPSDQTWGVCYILKK